MGFKIIGRKNGKKTVSDNPDDEATKVTSALKFLVEADPGAVSKGTTIRFLWDPKTGILFAGSKATLVKHPTLTKRLKRIKLNQTK